MSLVPPFDGGFDGGSVARGIHINGPICKRAEIIAEPRNG